MSFADPLPGSLVELAIRALLAVLAGAVVGVERQWHHRAAGMRTAPRCSPLGAAGFALTAHLLAMHRDPQLNPTQIAAGVVTGVGFLCGGVILQHGGSVQGLTTAASLCGRGGGRRAPRSAAGFYPLASVLVRRDPEHPVSAALGGGPVRAKHRTAGTVLPVGGAHGGSRPAVERLWARCLDGRTDAAAVHRVAIRTRREGGGVLPRRRS